MKPLLRSSLLVMLTLLPVGCAKTTVTDHAAVLPAERAVSTQRLGRTLLVIETALPDDKSALADEARERLRAALSGLPGHPAEPDTEVRLLERARAEGLDSVLMVRVEDYARRGELSLGLAVPPVNWSTRTVVSLRLRALDAADGTVIADLRRDRECGGPYTLRGTDDLASEMMAVVGSLFSAG